VKRRCSCGPSPDSSIAGPGPSRAACGTIALQSPGRASEARRARGRIDRPAEARTQLERMWSSFRQPADRELRDRTLRTAGDRPSAARRGAVLPRLERRPRPVAGSSASGQTRVASGTTEPALPVETAGGRLPGGFSYGDYLRCGAIARFSPIMGAVSAFRRRTADSCFESATGFQILTGSGAPARCAAHERVARLRLPRRRVPRRRRRHRLHVALRAGPGAHDPRQARRRLLFAARTARRARGERANRPGATPRRKPNGPSMTCRRSQCRGHVFGADAPPSMRRPAARLG